MSTPKKRKTGILVAVLLVLVFLVFVAGWLAVQMLDFSPGLGPVVGTNESEKIAPGAGMQASTPVIIKKMPAAPPPPPLLEKPDALRKALPEAVVKPAEVNPSKTEPDMIRPGGAGMIPAPVASLPPSALPPEPRKPEPSDEFSIQVGAFLTKEFADERVQILRYLGFDAYLYSSSGAQDRQWHTVRIGKYPSLDAAKMALSIFRQKTDISAVITPSDSLLAAPLKG